MTSDDSNRRRLAGADSENEGGYKPRSDSWSLNHSPERLAYLAAPVESFLADVATMWDSDVTGVEMAIGLCGTEDG